MVWKSSFEMMNYFTPWWVHNTHCQGNPVWTAIPATTFPSIPRKWPAGSFYQDTHRNHCAPLSLICLAFSKSRNHQDNAMSVLRFFDAANTDFRCVRPQWELNQSCLFTSHSFDLCRSLADLSKHLCFRTGINDGWSPKIMASGGPSNRTAFLDSPLNISYSMTSKWAIHR